MFTQKNKNNRPNKKAPHKKKSSNEETLEQKKIGNYLFSRETIVGV